MFKRQLFSTLTRLPQRALTRAACRYTYPNGDTYEGDWVAGKKQGTGVYTYTATGVKVRLALTQTHLLLLLRAVVDPVQSSFRDTYICCSKALTFVSTRHHIYHRRAQYDGQWNAGKMEGQGTYVFEGHAYSGAFTEDQPLGEGKFAFDHGAVQDGQFVVKASEGGEEDTAPRPKWVGDRVASVNQDE
jgi:radial spoke head protein 1